MRAGRPVLGRRSSYLSLPGCRINFTMNRTYAIVFFSVDVSTVSQADFRFWGIWQADFEIREEA